MRKHVQSICMSDLRKQIKLITRFSIINTGKENLHIGKWSWALLPLLLTPETHLLRGNLTLTAQPASGFACPYSIPRSALLWLLMSLASIEVLTPEPRHSVPGNILDFQSSLLIISISPYNSP